MKLKMNLFLLNGERFIIVLLALILLQGTQSCKSQTSKTSLSENSSEKIINKEYDLYKANEQDGLLVLFPGFGAAASNTKNEFDIVEIANENNVSVLYMNFNGHLYLKEGEKQELAENFMKILNRHGLSDRDITIGGYSSGGNVALLLSNYLIKEKIALSLKKVFIVDAPVDLNGLYQIAKRNLERNYSKSSMNEAKWLIDFFHQEFGEGQNMKEKIEESSPYLAEKSSINNLTYLKDIQLRFYSEPDTLWWREKRQNEPEDLNFHYISQLTEDLKSSFGEEKVELIVTNKRGYRANGNRHPHSWSIVDKRKLLDWIVNYD